MRVEKLAALLTLALPAFADFPPMTFKFVSGHSEVFAEGEIKADTPAVFEAFARQQLSFLSHTVMFNSPGGDLDAGLALGRAIRKAGWSTDIGTPGLSVIINTPGECSSACTFAFLGGKTRHMTIGSQFGVHRFWGPMQGDMQQATQQKAGELVAYIREMGVSTEMYPLMTEGAPKQVKYLDAYTMTRLRILTSETVEAKLTDENGISVLHLSDVDTGGQMTYGHMDFYCNGKNLLARAYFVPPLVPFNSNQFTLAWFSNNPSDIAHDRQVAIPSSSYWYRGANNQNIWIDIEVPAKLLSDWILPSTYIGVSLTQKTGLAFQNVEKDRVGNFADPLPKSFHTMVQMMQKSCY